MSTSGFADDFADDVADLVEAAGVRACMCACAHAHVFVAVVFCVGVRGDLRACMHVCVHAPIWTPAQGFCAWVMRLDEGLSFIGIITWSRCSAHRLPNRTRPPTKALSSWPIPTRACAPFADPHPHTRLCAFCGRTPPLAPVCLLLTHTPTRACAPFTDPHPHTRLCAFC